MTQTSLSVESSVSRQVLHLAIEMSDKSWRLAFTTGEVKSNGRLKTYHKVIDSRDMGQLQDAVEGAKKRLKVEQEVLVVCCYEAGQDGFWPHRQLEALGYDSRVVDSSSIEVNRQARRSKTDRLDAGKRLEKLVRAVRGEPDVWQEVRVPTEEEEDGRRLHREQERLKKEKKQHPTRIRSLCKLYGVVLEKRPEGRDWGAYILGLKRRLPEHLWREIVREGERLRLVKEQLGAIEAEQRQALEDVAAGNEVLANVLHLARLRGIGLGSAWVLMMEFFSWRAFKNRRQVASCGGLDPSPYASGERDREQGISKAGHKRIRWLMIELAWSWLRYQRQSALSQWFEARFGRGGKRMRRIGIVALARRLLVDLWRYVDAGVVPSGAQLKPALPTSA